MRVQAQYDRYPHLEGLSNDEKMLEYCRAWRSRNPERILFMAARQRAKVRGLEFNIEISDIIIPTNCPILNIPIVVHAGRGRNGGYEDSPSIDRIDNSKGYIKGNIQIISHKANSMKFTATPSELKRFAEWIMETYD